MLSSVSYHTTKWVNTRFRSDFSGNPNLLYGDLTPLVPLSYLGEGEIEKEGLLLS